MFVEKFRNVGVEGRGGGEHVCRGVTNFMHYRMMPNIKIFLYFRITVQ
jgi:hypothetical protein